MIHFDDDFRFRFLKVISIISDKLGFCCFPHSRNKRDDSNNPMKNRLLLRFLSVVLIIAVLFNLLLNDVTIRRSNEAGTGARSHHKQDWQVPRSEAAAFSFSTQSFNNASAATIRKTKKLWQDSRKIIPSWMKDYFEWHAETRQKLNESNWKDYHYLLQRCVQADKKCSGASDRLKAIPSVIRMAYTAQPRRLLFVYWSRPASLEAFLVPPQGGFDWRVPAWLEDKLEVERRGPKFWLDDAQAMQKWPTVPDQVVRIKNIRGSDYYEKMRAANEPSFEQVYRHCWNVVFEPSPAVAARIQEEMQSLQLKPHHYVAAHVRSLYVSDTQEQSEEEPAIQCAAQLLSASSEADPATGQQDRETKKPKTLSKIYFASDSQNVTKRGLSYGMSRNISIVARISDADPVHLDRGRSFLQNSDDWKTIGIESFYDIFVDLFLLASSRCVVFGVGGYGEWAAKLSEDYTCSINYRNTPCSNGTDNR